MVEPVRRIKRVIYWFLAAFFFTLAVVGVILPGIPTTKVVVDKNDTPSPFHLSLDTFDY